MGVLFYLCIQIQAIDRLVSTPILGCIRGTGLEISLNGKIVLRYHECSAKILLILCLSDRQSLSRQVGIFILNQDLIYWSNWFVFDKSRTFWRFIECLRKVTGKRWAKSTTDPFQPPTSGYISTFEICQMASQSVYFLHQWITFQTTASLRIRLCVRAFTTKWHSVVYLTCQQICEMAGMLRLSLRQSDWIFSLWLNGVYLPARGTR